MENYKIWLMKLKKDGKGILGIGFVHEPGVLLNVVKLSKTELKEPKILLSLNEEQRIVTGPFMIPNLKILRSAKQLGKEEAGYMSFDEETIRELFILSMKNGTMNNISLEHEVKTEGAFMIEAWLVLNPDNDLANELKYQIPKGTSMFSYQVTDDELWKDFKLGKYNGFSIEAIDFDKIELVQMQRTHEHEIPEAEEDWIYLIHHMHKPENEEDMEEIHHCYLFEKENEKGVLYNQKHIEDNKVFQHAIDFNDPEKVPKVLYDHLNNAFKIEIKEIDGEEYAIIVGLVVNVTVEYETVENNQDVQMNKEEEVTDEEAAKVLSEKIVKMIIKNK